MVKFITLYKFLIRYDKKNMYNNKVLSMKICGWYQGIYYRIYYNNDIKGIYEYRNNKKINKSYYYHDDILISYTCYLSIVKNFTLLWFFNGILANIKGYRNNNRNGIYLYYYPTGNIKIIRYYKDGSIIGNSYAFHMNGKIWNIERYYKGKLCSIKSWDMDGCNLLE